MSAADPVAEKSAFLKMYMSHHPDTLVAYAKFYGKVTDAITSAEMSGIDTKSMTLTCTKKDGSKQTVVIPIEPPLRGYDDVKPRLLEMKAHAQEGLGMIKAPRVTRFNIPLSSIFQTGALISLLIYCTLSQVDSTLALSPSVAITPSTSSLFLPGRYISNLTGGARTLKYSWGFMIGAHTLEALWTATLCRRHSTGFIVGAQYVLGTLLLGYPSWFALRKEIQSARIESVMKVE